MSLLRGPELPLEVLHTYKRHKRYALLGAMAMGIVANAPLMAVMDMDAPGWQLSLQLVISSIGMFLMLYLGDVMATRPKKPFVVLPGYATALVTLSMGYVSNVFVFLVLFGLGALFEVITRPAVTAIIRANYPATHRGTVTGAIRTWSSLLFMGTNLASSMALRLSREDHELMISSLLTLAALLFLASFLSFRGIHVMEVTPHDDGEQAQAKLSHLSMTVRRLARDRRFLRYLSIGFLYAFGALLYVAFIPAFLARELDFGYVESAALIHVVPGLMAFLLTGLLGRWIDRVNPWKAWSAIRLGWGLDPFLLALTFPMAALSPHFLFLLPALGRVSRGAVQGGSWILWWQLGINHFAPPGQDTTRYISVLIFVNGLARLLAPLTGAWLFERYNAQTLFLVGSGLVLLSAALSYVEYRREAKNDTLVTMASFEHSTEQDRRCLNENSRDTNPAGHTTQAKPR